MGNEGQVPEDPRAGSPPPEKAPMPEYLSPFSVDVQNPEKLMQLALEHKGDILAGPNTEEVSTKSTITYPPEIKLAKSNLTLKVKFPSVISDPKSDRFQRKHIELKSILKDAKRVAELQTLLQTHVNPNLRIKDGFLTEYFGMQGGLESFKKIGRFDNYGNFEFNPPANISSSVQFEQELRRGLEIFRIYLSETYKANKLSPPTATLLISPDVQSSKDEAFRKTIEELTASAGKKPERDLSGLVGERKPQTSALTKETADKHFQGAKAEEIEALRQAIIVEERPNVTFEQVAGQEKAVEEAKRLKEQIAHPEVFESWGVDPPRGILFYGPPGTGKTLLGKALANEANAAFVQVNSSDIASKWYGDSEKFAKGIFEIAREEAEKHNGTCILFLDEVDSLVQKREGTTHEATRKVIGTLLREIDGLKTQDQKGRVIVVAATNNIDIIDPAFLNRMTNWVEVPLPDAEGRAKILKIHLEAKGQKAKRQIAKEDINLENLAQSLDHASGRDIADIVDNALRKKGSEQVRKLSPDLLTEEDIKATIEESSKVREAKKSSKRSQPIGFTVPKGPNSSQNP